MNSCGAPSVATPRIAIVGGGFSGTMTSFHLLRLVPSASVTMFERVPAQIAGGNAYTPSSEHHLLNVPAGSMGARAQDPGEFLQWLIARDQKVQGSSFVSRRFYGEYLTEILTHMRETATGHFQTIFDEVVSIRRPPSAELEIRTAAGTLLKFDHLIIATGTTPRIIPTSGTKESLRHRVVMRPWSESIFKVASPTDSIALVGSGLSAVDILVEGSKQSFQGSYRVISPRGAFPCMHAEDLSPIAPLPATPPWTSVLGALRGIRALTSNYAEWQHAIDALRPHLNKIWNNFPEVERHRFLRHAATIWDRHRHRMPRSAFAVISQLQAEGRLTIHTGQASKITASSSHAAVVIRGRGSQSSREIQADRVVNCSGFTLNITHSPSPLTKSLLENRLGHIGNYGCGWRCDENGALTTPEGQRIPGLWAIGSLRRGSELECTAARELRVQAENLAKSVAQEFQGSLTTASGPRALAVNSHGIPKKVAQYLE